MDDLRGREVGLLHKRWGYLVTMAAEEDLPVAAVTVAVLMPGDQHEVIRHAKRHEAWMALGPGLRGRIGTHFGELIPAMRYDCPAGVWHSIENVGDHPVRLVVTMLGEYDEYDVEHMQK